MPGTKSDSFLELLYWAIETLSTPTLGKLTESFESWEYRHKIKPRLKSLARSQLIRIQGPPGEPFVHLTPQGRLSAIGGINAMARWQRKWDGRWRLLIFDLPVAHSTLRVTLWRWLKSHRLGYLQQSVWISPDPIDQRLLPLRQLDLSAKSYIVVDARPAVPNSDADLVKGSWDFRAANRAYATVIELCNRALQQEASNLWSRFEHQRWLTGQRSAWLKALSLDPLLPARLLPPEYLGWKAWQARQLVFHRLLASPAAAQKLL